VLKIVDYRCKWTGNRSGIRNHRLHFSPLSTPNRNM